MAHGRGVKITIINKKEDAAPKIELKGKPFSFMWTGRMIGVR